MELLRGLTSRPSRRRHAVVVAGVALLLSSCGGNAPGVAAEVDGQRITDRQVDDFARVLCALGGAGQEGAGAATPSKAARFSALQILLADRLAAGVADVESVDQATLAGARSQLAASRDALPEELRGTFDEVAEEYSRSQTAILELGRSSLEEAGRTDVGDEEAFAEGERLRAAYARQADISVDPRFGTVVDGQLQPSGGSLSVPVSDLAQKSAAPQPPPDLVELLPVAQTCG